MTWFKVDDRFPESDKVIELVLRPEGLAALGVWTLCGAWAAGRGNGGRITEAVVKRFRGTRKHVTALVAVGLWDASDDEWRFHDWDDYNESAEAAEAVKFAEREAGRRGNHERWHVKRGIVAKTCPFCIAPESGGDRVPDTDPESGAIPPGPGPVPDPDLGRTDTPDSHTSGPVGNRASGTDEGDLEALCARQAGNLGVDFAKVRNQLGIATGRLPSPTVVMQIIATVIERATPPVKSPTGVVLTAVKRDWAEWQKFIDTAEEEAA